MKKSLKKILAFILTLCMICSLFPVAYAEASDSGMTKEELEVLKIVNQEREKEGLAPLTSLPELQKATDIRAQELVELFSHTRPNGNACYTVFKEVTLPSYKTAGENIAAGQSSPEGVMNSWMNSSGHKANILKGTFVHVGVGHYYQKDTTYRNHWVQMFFAAFGCAYTSMTLSLLEDKAVPLGTAAEDLGIVACLECKACGKSYLPALESYCTGYDPNKSGVQTVTVSCLGQTATIDVTVEAPEVDTSINIYHSLELTSDITMNFVVEEARLADYDNFYLECILPVYEGNTLVSTKTVVPEPTLKNGYYYFALKELTAVQMADVVEATLHLQKDGSFFVSPTDHYSISTYAYNQFDNAKATDALKKVCADLLVYGSSAQIFKSYRTDCLADLRMTEEDRAYCTDLGTVTFGTTNTDLKDVPDAPLTWKGKTLNLESRVSLKFVFDATDYTGDPRSLTLRVVFKNQDGVHCTHFISGAKEYGQGNLYYYEFNGLLASELRTPLSLSIMNGATVLSSTLTYSADAYGNGRTGNLLTLCKALFAYSDSAKAFFGA